MGIIYEMLLYHIHYYIYNIIELSSISFCNCFIFFNNIIMLFILNSCLLQI